MDNVLCVVTYYVDSDTYCISGKELRKLLAWIGVKMEPIDGDEEHKPEEANSIEPLNNDDSNEIKSIKAPKKIARTRRGRKSKG